MQTTLSTLGARSLLAVSASLIALGLSACGKPADATATQSAPAAAPTVAAPATPAAAPTPAPAAAADKKDAIDPLAHEGVPGLSDLFSKKKEGGGH